MKKIEATSTEAQSADLMAENIAQIKALFPELLTESANGIAINVEVLKQLVGDASVTEAEEKYGLNWQEHLLPGRTEADILYELLLKRGLDLCVPIEKRSIAGKEVHAIGGGVLIACLSENISRENVEPLAQGIVVWHKELAPAGDTTCVFRDSAFADDVAKTNLAAILEQHGISNVRSL